MFALFLILLILLWLYNTGILLFEGTTFSQFLLACFEIELLDNLTVCKELLMINGWLIVWVLRHINLCWLFNAESIFMQIVSSISNNSV